MLEIDYTSLTFIYEKVEDSITLTVPLLHKDDEVKELKFDIFNTGGLYRTVLNYKDANRIEIPSNTNLEVHFKDLQAVLECITFCKTCDSVCQLDFVYEGNCFNCTFVRAFKQDHYEHTCCICQEKIENDWLKVTCCGNFFHKTCRFKYGKWLACPLCKAEDFSY